MPRVLIDVKAGKFVLVDSGKAIREQDYLVSGMRFGAIVFPNGKSFDSWADAADYFRLTAAAR